MQSSDRYHALDAVRGIALLLGIALHAAQPYIAGLPWIAPEPPSMMLAGIWYTIHMFRMPVFFLIAGFFARLMVERRGLTGFIRDRSRRILVPLVIGVPLLMLITGVAYVIGALVSGADLHTLHGLHPPASPEHRSAIASINLIHLWFLYYLLLFYAGVLILRSICSWWNIPDSGIETAPDRSVRFLATSIWGPIILALPIAGYYAESISWSPWGGLPTPMSIIPDDGALLAYGLFFGFGWLLHRQPETLRLIENRWLLYCALAILAWGACRVLAGSTPHWGPFLKGESLLAYAGSYMVASWSGTLGLIGIAMRFCSGFSPLRRYIADSSYWIYLMHIPVLLFFEEVFHPLHLNGDIKYVTCMAAALPILFLSYHYLVRFTFIGATLNGRRHRRAEAATLKAATL